MSPTKITKASPAPEPLWTVADVATYVGVPIRTVYRWNSRNEGPPYLRIGKHARYRRGDVEAWVAGCTSIASA